MHVPSPEEERMADLEMKDEDLIAPIYEDIVDFEAANEAHQANKAEFAKRKREERERQERQSASEPKKDTPDKHTD